MSIFKKNFNNFWIYCIIIKLFKNISIGKNYLTFIDIR